MEAPMTREEKLARHRDHMRRVRVEKRARGECFDCPSPASPGSRLCGPHRAVKNRRMDARKAARFAAGICEMCPTERVGGKRHCEPCLEKLRQKAKDWRIKKILKEEADRERPISPRPHNWSWQEEKKP